MFERTLLFLNIMRVDNFKLLWLNGLIALFFVFFFTTCKKEAVENPIEFYVKYVIDGNSSYQQSKTDGLKVTLTNENSVSVDYIRSNRGAIEFIVGPVKRGFNAKLVGTNVCCVNCCYIKPSLQIFLSENNGPFVLKKEETVSQYTDVVQIDYTIQ